MADDITKRIYGDMNTYILDWLVAKPAKRPQVMESSVDDEANRINALMAMLSKDSGGERGNVLPFKTRKK